MLSCPGCRRGRSFGFARTPGYVAGADTPRGALGGGWIYYRWCCWHVDCHHRAGPSPGHGAVCDAEVRLRDGARCKTAPHREESMDQVLNWRTACGGDGATAWRLFRQARCNRVPTRRITGCGAKHLSGPISITYHGGVFHPPGYPVFPIAELWVRFLRHRDQLAVSIVIWRLVLQPFATKLLVAGSVIPFPTPSAHGAGAVDRSRLMRRCFCSGHRACCCSGRRPAASSPGAGMYWGWCLVWPCGRSTPQC